MGMEHVQHQIFVHVIVVILEPFVIKHFVLGRIQAILVYVVDTVFAPAQILVIAHLATIAPIVSTITVTVSFTAIAPCVQHMGYVSLQIFVAAHQIIQDTTVRHLFALDLTQQTHLFALVAVIVQVMHNASVTRIMSERTANTQYVSDPTKPIWTYVQAVETVQTRIFAIAPMGMSEKIVLLQFVMDIMKQIHTFAAVTVYVYLLIPVVVQTIITDRIAVNTTVMAVPTIMY